MAARGRRAVTGELYVVGKATVYGAARNAAAVAREWNACMPNASQRMPKESLWNAADVALWGHATCCPAPLHPGVAAG